MPKPRYLTKSRFKLALECPTKLYYTGKPDYADSNTEDPFLKALANGGYQVGELAKHYFPGGMEVSTLDYDQALAETAKLLARDQVTIFEAAVRFENLFIRIDILVKQGQHITFYEVKSKSFDSTDQNEFVGKRGGIVSTWRPYLEDVAFQKHVLTRAYPGHTVTSYLLMAEKNTPCPVNGLNQKFRVTKDENRRKSVAVSSTLTAADLVEPRILKSVNVDDICGQIYLEAEKDHEHGYSGKVESWASAYAADSKIDQPFTGACKSCEFQASKEDLAVGLKSGQLECWQKQLGWTAEQAQKPTILDIWSLHYTHRDRLIENGQISLHDLNPADIAPKTKGKSRSGLSPHDRQTLQIEKIQKVDDTPYIDKEMLASEFSTFKFPLTFIDFETAMAAIPFNAGRTPYDGIAFQYSVHTLDKEGNVAHQSQYLDATPGKFPNFDFVRALKRDLEGHEGTIFRYAAHENSYLNMIYRQLSTWATPPADAEELKAFIRLITNATRDSVDQWTGARTMVDLCQMAKNYYYDPRTNGSNSIKHVFPAVLSRSKFLQEKYSKPVYGAPGGIKSLNFRDWQWIQRDEGGQIKDPYGLLPPVFEGITDRNAVWLSDDDDDIHEGGAAMTAYVRMQFEEMSEIERKAITAALLKYCELDTLAMVMLYEGWRDLIGQ